MSTIQMTLAVVLFFPGLAAFPLLSTDEPVPEVIDVMTKVNGKKGLISQVKASAKGGKWQEADEQAKELMKYGEAMGKNKPPKGDAESWKKLTKKYEEDVRAIVTAVEKREAVEVDQAVAAFTNQKNCAACHNAHRP